MNELDNELALDTLATLDGVINDAELGLDPLKAPYLMFTPEAAKILADALRFRMEYDVWLKLESEVPNSDWDDDGQYIGDAGDLWS